KTGDSELAGIRAGESGVDVAFSIETGTHGDEIGADVENVSNNLCSGGFVPLALRTTADGDDNFAIDIELTICTLRVTGKRSARVYDLRLAEIVGSGIECGADPDSDQAAISADLFLLLFPFVPADKFFGDFKHLRIVPRVINTAVGRGVRELFRPHVIAQAHFVGGNFQFVRADVNHTF